MLRRRDWSEHFAISLNMTIHFDYEVIPARVVNKNIFISLKMKIVKRMFFDDDNMPENEDVRILLGLTVKIGEKEDPS